MSRTRCIDCGQRAERYMVHDHIWPLAPHGGELCFLCLARRLGRVLTPADFTDAPINRRVQS